VDVRSARAAALAHTAPPRTPHAESCIPARRLRRVLSNTNVTGDVSGWSVMTALRTEAAVMCAPRAPLCSLTQRRRVNLTQRAASPRVACAEAWMVRMSLAMSRAGQR
jgi:hypothetical protein